MLLISFKNETSFYYEYEKRIMVDPFLFIIWEKYDE